MWAVACMTIWAAGANALEPMTIQLTDNAPPGVFLSAEEMAAAQQRAATQPWAQAVRDSILREADAMAAEPLDIPHSEGQWTHWYTCPDDGGALDARSPTEHVCRICGKVHTGWPYDQVYVTKRHSHWLRGVETLGEAYTLDPKPAYAERIRAILLEYASFYRDLKLHDVHDKQGSSKARLYAQTLDESVTLCHISFGYDRVYGAPCFSEADHHAIAEGLLRPMAATIQPNLRLASNWQSWHNAGVGCAGFVLRDPELVDWAINGNSGFLFQMQNSLKESGMWYEEAPSYHWYAVLAHVYLMEAAASAGIDLYGIPMVKKMFDAPMRPLFPDLTYPAINDSDRSSISGSRMFYEVAYRRYHDPKYLVLLPPRESAWALLWGEDILEDKLGGKLKLETSNDASEGLAVLRDATGESAAFLYYGPGTSGHVQPAKLSLLLYAQGEERFIDPGRMPYGNPLHGGWYRQTLAHNTVVMNGASQKQAPGALTAFRREADFAVLRATCPKAYDGVTLDRTLFMRGNLIFDVFRCVAPNEATFDLPLHMRGEAADWPATEPCDPLGEKDGYQYLKELERFQEIPKSLTLNTADQKRIVIGLHDAATAYRALGFGASPQELLPVVIRRLTGSRAVFVSSYQILEPGEIAAEVAAQQQGEEVRVHSGGTTLIVGEETAVETDGKAYPIAAESTPTTVN